jgi:DNA-binding NarL/FixJ family response regulator
MNTTIKVAIADDHPLIVNGLCNVLSAYPDIEVVATYENGELLLEGFKQLRPDILLLDIQMPGMQGDVICKTITRLYANIKVIALTNLDNVFYIRTMLKAGALGYLLKTAPQDHVVNAIRTVFANGQYLDRELQDSMRQSSLPGNTIRKSPLLTAREKEVLQLIAENNTSKEIAEKLFLSKRTIDHHRNNLLLKLDVKNSAGLIKKAMRMDLL